MIEDGMPTTSTEPSIRRAMLSRMATRSHTNAMDHPICQVSTGIQVCRKVPRSSQTVLLKITGM